jgi:hypothetical protein
MPYRIRERADGLLEVEMDTADEVRALLSLARGDGGAPLLRAGGPALAPRRARRQPRRGGAPRTARTPPVPSDRDARILDLLKPGPRRTGGIAEGLHVTRGRARQLLNALASRGLIHATGATASRRWHHGPSTPAAARRAL